MVVFGIINREGCWILSDSIVVVKYKEEWLFLFIDVDFEFERVIGEWFKKLFEFNRITYVLEVFDIIFENILMDLKRVLRFLMFFFK